MAAAFWVALATVSAGAFGLSVAALLGTGDFAAASARSLVVGSGAVLCASLLSGAQAAYLDRREARTQAARGPVVPIRLKRTRDH